MHYLMTTTAAARLWPHLLAVVGLLALLALAGHLLVRHFGHRATGATGGRRMRVLERLPLGQRSALLLVEVDGARMVLGAADGRVELIKELKADLDDEGNGDGA